MDDYCSFELQLEQIEERLDTSQDKQRIVFGIDDQVIARSVTLSEKIVPPVFPPKAICITLLN